MNDATKTALVICALRRHGKPATASELADAAIGLAQAANWPRRSWEAMSSKVAAALLKGAERRGEVLRDGEVKDNGVARPLWVPVWANGFQWDRSAPMPDEPDPEGEDHALHGKTKREVFVLYDVLDASVQTMSRQRREMNDMLDRHNRELSQLIDRLKAKLESTGLFEGAL